MGVNTTTNTNNDFTWRLTLTGDHTIGSLENACKHNPSIFGFSNKKIDISKLAPGKHYNISGWDVTFNEHGEMFCVPDAKEICAPTRNKNFSNSEGLDRQITEVRVSKHLDKRVVNELIAIGQKEGFTVTVIQNKNNCPWIEDYSNFRPDGTVMILNEEIHPAIGISESRKCISPENAVCQGAVVQRKASADYQQQISQSDVVKGKTYLEGGNVLTTYNANGEPSAIIGEESFMAAEKSLLDSGTQNLSYQQILAAIAKDLGVSPKNITIIPQYDFHIDMCYRPLKNGQMAVPDYEGAISILENTKLEGVSEADQKELLDQLKLDCEKTKQIREQAVKKLMQGGYSIVKIPCFSTIYDKYKKKDPKTNYMNAVCGTSSNGTYYITNKSDYPALDKIIARYFKKAGIDRIYFVSTTHNLHDEGGIDCLTKEVAKKVK